MRTTVEVFPGATDDGRAATVVVTVDRPPAPDSFGRADVLTDAALCGGDARAAACGRQAEPDHPLVHE
ncbi:hypothetical protein ABZ667_18175 [Streptomyces lavendulae]|uniref:hypothetical protein n=1 Tax=Streptomyces lavendulae TaxID=1914 RepID=UPI00340D33A4